jgi:hypothetical protein
VKQKPQAAIDGKQYAENVNYGIDRMFGAAVNSVMRERAHHDRL